jgi:hypothetical protein
VPLSVFRSLSLLGSGGGAFISLLLPI